jgi:hypothetical protein
MTHNEIADIFAYLRPSGGWVVSGDDIDNAIYDDGVEPISQAEFDAGVIAYKEFLSDKADQKAALLDRLGISQDEAKLLLS